MEFENERLMCNKQKAKFYYTEKIKCHIIKNPKGFVNGIFISDLINHSFYWFEDMRYPGSKLRLFLIDIFDIKDYREKIL